MFNNSALTLQDVKDQLGRELNDTRITDADIIDGVNDFYSIVQRLDRNDSIEKYEGQSAAIAITSSGYDLSLLTDIGELKGLKVWEGEKKTYNRRTLRFEGSLQAGYSLSGNTLYLTPTLTGSDSRTIYINYTKKTDRVAIGSVLSDNLLQIDQDLERTLRKYLRHSFFEGEYQFDLSQEAEAKAMAELERYFDGNKSPRGW